jgi:hypothetical protein
MKVYNKSKKPIVWRNDWRGKMVVQPGKFSEIDKKNAEQVLKRFPDALCTEEEFDKPDDKPEKKEKKAEKAEE